MINNTHFQKGIFSSWKGILIPASSGWNSLAHANWKKPEVDNYTVYDSEWMNGPKENIYKGEMNSGCL